MIRFYVHALLISVFGFVNASSAESYKIDELVRMTNDVNEYKGGMLFSPNNQPLKQKGLVRFDTSREIPLYFVQEMNGEIPQEILVAVERVEQLLGNIFSDFKTLRYDTSSEFNAASFSQTTGVSGGLVVSVGTGYSNSNDLSISQSSCANVGVGPNTGNLFFWVDPETGLYLENTILWINIGRDQCEWDVDLVVHEFAHALGMFKHIDCVFSDGSQNTQCQPAPSWSPKAEEVLRAIYRNSANTPYSALQ